MLNLMFIEMTKQLNRYTRYFRKFTKYIQTNNENHSICCENWMKMSNLFHFIVAHSAWLYQFADLIDSCAYSIKLDGHTELLNIDTCFCITIFSKCWTNCLWTYQQSICHWFWQICYVKCSIITFFNNTWSHGIFHYNFFI